MTTQLKVEYEIEQLNQVRFWLATEVNGRKVTSRGTVVTIDKPTTEEIRNFARRIGYSVSAKIFDNQWTAANAKEANAALPGFVNDAIAEDAALDAAFSSLAK